MTTYGYVYVSPSSLSEDTQRAALGAMGVEVTHIDRCADSRSPRPQRGALLDEVREGDTVAVAEASALVAGHIDGVRVLAHLATHGVGVRESGDPVGLVLSERDAFVFTRRAVSQTAGRVARTAGAAGGRSAKPRPTGEDAVRIRAMWHDLNVPTHKVLVACTAAGAPGLTAHNLRADWGPRRSEEGTQ